MNKDVPRARALPNEISSRAVSWRWFALLAIFIAVVALSFFCGSLVPFSDLWSHDASRAEAARQIFLEVRRDRLLAGLLVGACLATSGVALQATFRNPLAEPYLLGISGGGALGATIALALRLPGWRGFEPAAIFAFFGSLAAAWGVYALGRNNSQFDRANLLLIGVALSAFLGALMALVITLSSYVTLAQQAMFWLLGSLMRATPQQNWVLGISLGAGVLLLLASARDLNALRVGDDEAATLGVEIGTLHRRLLLAAALMSAAAVAAAGLVGFIGLLAPHLTRLIFGSDARILIPAAALGGAALLAGCDALARSAASPVEVPVGIVTALLGVPLFLFLARRV